MSVSRTPLSEYPGYTEYLASPAWAALRHCKLGESGHRCEGCGDSERLEVHHLSYDRFGKERVQDLMVLCHLCHAREHGRTPSVGPIAGLTADDHVRRGTGPDLLRGQENVLRAIEIEELARRSDGLADAIKSATAARQVRRAARSLRAAARFLA